MDVCINSQIQSPLVRTLAQTQGKSASFTLGLADNVPPCSFSKIEIASQNPGETSYGRSYKLKIPQYGYLRDVILRYTTRESPIQASVASVTQELYKQTYFALDDVQVAGSHVVGSPATATPNLSWYNLNNYVVSTSFTGDQRANAACKLLAPQFSQLITAGSSATSLGSAPNGTTAVLKGDSTPDDNIVSLTTTAPSLVGTASAAGPYTQLVRMNGNPALWSSILRFYHSIYQLQAADQAGANFTNTKPFLVAKMVWAQLLAEPRETVRMPLYSSANLPAAYAPVQPNGVITDTAGAAVTGPPVAATQLFDCVLPPYMTTVSRGGVLFYIPKMPQLQFDATGTLVGVKFVAMHLLHPNDQADATSQMFLTGRLQTDTNKQGLNYREFAFNPSSTDTEWKPWDWQTESQYYPGFTANLADRIVLSTHNRPIQTIFPQEVFGRVQRMPAHDRYRYLKMMKPRVSKQGTCGTQAGEKIMYQPVLLHSTENPSFNLDTRFVEQLDLDVYVNNLTDIYNASDLAVSANAAPLSFATWVEKYRSALFYFEWRHSLSGGNTIEGPIARGSVTASASGWTISSSNTTATLEALEISKVATVNPTAFDAYSVWSPPSYVIGLRTCQNVPADYIKVEALLYYHNFHDATAQAIRDSNFKPGEPASVLAYNTYAESEMIVKVADLQQTNTINIPITSNNLIFGTYFVIKRRRTNLKYGNKRDHMMQTLPIKRITLTASGQQIYTSANDELALTDTWDYDLATGKVGRKYLNSVLIQSRDDLISGETFYLYYIPFSFSSDMTYNSGSLAFQTLNNPMLSIEINVGATATQPFDIIAQEGEWSIRVYHNYWNMLRIDSNTGSITKSLDL